MSYCINPNCSQRSNSDDLKYCQDCGTKLLINERYQIVKPLRAGLAYNSEVFEVSDLNEWGTSKVLKSLVIKSTNTKLAELFNKEAQVLIWLSSEWQKHPGIPHVKPDGCFTFSLGNGCRKLHCLVMEKIEGQNLEEWLEENQPISQEQALNWMQQLVEILDKVHAQGLWHRDIKPSNIMLKPDGQLVLIDFGAVGVGETRIVSADYTPKEQIEGKTVEQSDFFALGRTFVYLLTGKHPSELPQDSQTQRLIWRKLAPTISKNLAQLIDELMAPVPAKRPKNTKQVLQRLQTIDRRRLPVKVLYIVGAALLLGLAGILILKPILNSKTPRLEKLKNGEDVRDEQYSKAVGDNLSLGEEILRPDSLPAEKKMGVEAFRHGRYETAVNYLEKAWNNQKSDRKTDPETLIYLNNARIEQRKIKSYSIAVAVPLDTSLEGFNSGLEILRGVAQAQDEFNQSQKGVGIKVLIADDANRPRQAKQIAENLVKQKEVIAVVGHYTSDLTLAAADIYQQNQLVFISPTSTSEDLSAIGKSKKPNFFFRTVPSDRVTAQTLADYLKQKGDRQTVAVFYSSNSRYSQSLNEQFRNRLSKSGGTVLGELVDLSSANPEQAIEKARQQGANVLALFPNSHNMILDNTKTLINANQCRSPMVGGDTLYSNGILKGVDRAALNCLIVAVAWHSKDSPNPEFPKAALELWEAHVSWRTAFAYDAIRALVAAIETQGQPNRQTVQEALAAPNFQANGATGEIQFEEYGDRKKLNMKLVKVALDPQGKPMFTPLDATP
jgi:eukaryotic-like serine/threonine-protein kinase